LFCSSAVVAIGAFVGGECLPHPSWPAGRLAAVSFRLTSLLGRRVNHLANFGDFRARKSTDFRMLIDDGHMLWRRKGRRFGALGKGGNLSGNHFFDRSDWQFQNLA